MPTTYQTTTQQSGPPAWQQPYLQQGLQYSQNLLNAGAPQQYPGQTVTPFSQATEQAMQGIQQRATAGSPLVNQAQSYVGNQLQQPVSSQFGQAQNPYASGGNPFGGATNPHLDQTFQRAAQQSRGQLESEFARSGRNLNAAAPIRGEQLNNLATSIYGGAYEGERNRQYGYGTQQLGIGAQGFENAQQRQLSDVQNQRGNNLSALSQVPGLANQQYVDYSALAGVGAQMEGLTSRYQQDAQNRFNYEQQAPGMQLDQYLQRTGAVNGGQNSTTQTPFYSSTAGNALGGALVGSSIGSNPAFGANGGLWGAGIGALLGMRG